MSVINNANPFFEALRRAYPANQYAILPEVRNAAGFNATRTADFLIMGLWPSRGLELWGIELKCSRADFLREIKNPEKADVIAAYCDRWFLLVSDDSVASAEELPPAWGLMVLGRTGLKMRRQAQLLEAKPISRSFLAALLKRAQETSAGAAEIATAVKVAREEAMQSRKWGAEQTVRELADLRARVKEFETASGVDIGGYSYTPTAKIGAAVKLVLDGGHLEIPLRLRNMADQLGRIQATISAELATMNGDAP